MSTAKERYDYLSSDRSQFLSEAKEASELTLPYLISGHEENTKGMKSLKTPWQSVGAKGVVALASKLSLSLVPPQTSFFKLQVDETQLGQIPPEIKSELDLSFSKIERTILDAIAASDDRVVIHQALQHLVVGGNALIFMGKAGLKLFPLNRYVIERDGNGEVIEIITKERINKKLIEEYLPPQEEMPLVTNDEPDEQECDVYTHVTRDNNRFLWHQEVYGKIIPKSQSKAPIEATPWLPLRFNTVDGEAYGRGRVGQFIGDLKSLEALSQALVEGSAAAAKVVFLVSPSSTTKPKTIADAGNGAIVQGRPEDVAVIQVGKTADFATAANLAQQIEKRLADAFLVLNVRDSERTTAEEVRMTQMELEQQLGGLFSLLTVEFLIPYLNRTLLVLNRSNQLPKIPKDLARPTIVAGINALGRGQDREALTQFIGTIAQTLGPEALMQYLNPGEAIKRLATAQGIDVLNLVKTEQQMQQEAAAAQQQQVAGTLLNQAGQIAGTPMMDPSKNPDGFNDMSDMIADQVTMGQEQQQAPPQE